MTALRLYTRADLLDAALPPGGVAFLERDRLLGDLVEEAWARRGRGVRLGAVGEALLLQILAAEAGGPLAGLQAMPGLRRSLGALFQAAGSAGLSPAQFQRLLQRLGGRAPGAQPRLQELGRLYGRYRALLGARLCDEAAAWRRGVQGLAQNPPAAVAGGVELHGLWLVPEGGRPTRHARLLALAALSAGEPESWLAREAPPLRSVPVRVVLPAVEGRPALEAALEPLLQGLYRYHALHLEEVRQPLADAATPYGRFLRGLFLPGAERPLLAPGELPGERLTLSPAATPAAEARAAARAVRDLVDDGVPPGAIVVVAQRPASRRLLRAALQRYGVVAGSTQPLGEPEPGQLLADSPPAQAVLSLYSLLEAGAPREPFIQLLLSQYLRWGRGAVPSWHLVRALREAGVRDLRPPGRLAGVEPDYRRRLHEWWRQQGAGRRPRDGADPIPYSALVGALESALGLLDGLPAEATTGAHAAALRRLLGRLQLEANARGRPDLLPDAEDGAALGRDQEAAAALGQALDELVLAAQRLGHLHRRLPRERFAQLLAAALQQVALRPRSLDGAAVVVTDLLGAAGRRCAHLFVTGMVDGQLPARAPDDPLLSDDERRGLNRLLGHDVFPLASSAEQLCPLWFVAALAGAGAAHLSWPAADETGRPLLRSPYVDEVLRAAARPEPESAPLAVVPAAAEARCPEELWLRAALDGYAPGTAARALLAELARREPERAAHLAARIDIERARLRWFAARLDPAAAAEPGPFVGRLRDAALRQRLQGRLPGSPDHPLSASALEDYAKCPFRFFVRRVLRAEPVQEGGDDLDALAGGRLHHEVLEKFFLERRDAGRLPLRGDEDDRAALERTIAAVLAAWPDKERTGHRELFGVRVRRLREDLWRLVEREAVRPIAPGLVPRLFEHRFGPLAISSPSEQGAMALHIFGIIDRVDVGPGRALVLDYKTGRLDRYEQILRHDLLDTSFQLPLYAAALKVDPTLRELGLDEAEVTARYYSLRSGCATLGELRDQQMISLDPREAAQAPERNVAEVSYRLWRRLRDGDFRVDPKTCEGCGLEAACRVTPVEPREEWLEEPRTDEAGQGAPRP